jgi:hypothetical protein
MPKPNPNESEADFVARYMSSEEAKKRFPDEKQRLAVAYSEYKRHKKESKSFTIFMPVSKSWESKIAESDNQRFIQMIVSGLKEDRDGEKMSQLAINGMIEQYKSGKIPLFADHGKNSSGERTYSWKGILGVFEDAFQEGDNLIAVARLNKSHPDHEMLWGFLKEKMPLGFSIGGKAIEIIEEDVVAETEVQEIKEVQNEEKKESV